MLVQPQIFSRKTILRQLMCRQRVPRYWQSRAAFGTAPLSVTEDRQRDGSEEVGEEESETVSGAER